MISVDRDALRELLVQRGWEREGPPYETWWHEHRDEIFQFCEDPPRAGHVFHVRDRGAGVPTLVLTIEHARALLDLRPPGVR